MTREQAIKEIGIEAVKAVEGGEMEETNRVTSGTADQGWTEFVTSIDIDECTLIMTVLVSDDELDSVEELDQIDWVTAITETAKYEIA